MSFTLNKKILIPIIATFILIIAIASVFFYQTLATKTKKTNQNKKLVVTSNTYKSANYNIALANEIDEYVEANVDLDEIKGELEIDANDILTIDQFSDCSGDVVITKDKEQYTYTISSSCNSDSGNGSNLVIKKYTGLNNLGLNNLIKLEPIEDGYIGVFDYSKTAGECKTTSSKCDASKTGFAIVKINKDGEIEKLSSLDRFDLGYDERNLISVHDIYLFKDSYFVIFSVIGNEMHKDFEDEVINMSAKYDTNLNRIWAKGYNVPGVTRTIKLGDSIGLVENWYEKNVIVNVMDPSDGTVNRKIQFDGQSNSDIVYNNYAFYDFYDTYYIDDSLQKSMTSANLIKYDKDGNTVYSKDNKPYLTNDSPSDFKLERKLFINNKYIFLKSSEYANEYVIPNSYVNVYDLDGNFIKTHLTSDSDNKLADGFDKIIYENDNYYSLVQRNELKFVVDTFDNTNAKINSNYYEAYTDSQYYSAKYIADDNSLTFYASSKNNEGEIIILFFD